MKLLISSCMLALLAVSSLLALAGQGRSEETKRSEAKPAEAKSGEAKPARSKPAGAPNAIVVIETSLGDVKAELYADKAPITVKNFLSYVQKGHYNGTIFHRVIPGFMIQGGGFEMDGTEKPTDPPIKNESGNGLRNERGTLAMARTSAPDSAAAQFFINVVDNRSLDKDGARDGVGYAVFGKVTDGMDVVDKIKLVQTATKNDMADWPVQPVVIKTIRKVN